MLLLYSSSLCSQNFVDIWYNKRSVHVECNHHHSPSAHPLISPCIYSMMFFFYLYKFVYCCCKQYKWKVKFQTIQEKIILMNNFKSDMSVNHFYMEAYFIKGLLCKIFYVRYFIGEKSEPVSCSYSQTFI